MPDRDLLSGSREKYSDSQTEKTLKTTEEFDCERRGYKLTKNCLGTGAYAKVKLAYATNSKIEKDKKLATELKQKGTNKVAIKIISRKHAPKEYVSKFMPREIETLYAAYRSSNVIQLYETFRTDARVYLVMEFASKGDLLEFINDKANKTPGIGETKAKDFFRQLVAGIQHCHRRNVVHRDLKCENILIDDENETVKISDFGFATRFPTNKQQLLETFCGSYAYAAPEILKAQKYDGKIADVWSLGIILFAMVNGRLPYNDRDIRTLIKQTQSKPRFSSRVSLTPVCEDLICKILTADLTERATLNDIIRHQWLVDDEKPRGIPDGKSDEVVTNEKVINEVPKYNLNLNKKIVLQPYTQRVLHRERWMKSIPEPQAIQKLLHTRINKTESTAEVVTPQVQQRQRKQKIEIIGDRTHNKSNTDELLMRYCDEKRKKQGNYGSPYILLPNKYQEEPTVPKIVFRGIKTKTGNNSVETTYRLSPNKQVQLNPTPVTSKKRSHDQFLTVTANHTIEDPTYSLPPVDQTTNPTTKHKRNSAPAQHETQCSPDEFKKTTKHERIKYTSAKNNKSFRTRATITNFAFKNPGNASMEVMNLRRNWQSLKQNAGVQSPAYESVRNNDNKNIELTFYTLSGKEVNLQSDINQRPIHHFTMNSSQKKPFQIPNKR